MKRFATILAAAGAVALVAGCADYGDYGPGYGPPGYDYYGPVAPVAWDGYYDGYYGPFYNGYWGGDGFFYYQTSDNDTWHRDTGHHFSRQASDGFRPVQGHPHAAPPRPMRRDRGPG